MLVLTATAQAGWIWLEDWGAADYAAHEGSALCAGVATEDDGVTRNCLWFLESGMDHSQDNFWRYDVDVQNGDKRHITTWSGEFCDWGGALAFMPDPFSEHPNGWVFAFRGNESHDFLIYSPTYNVWNYTSEAPEEVEAGGALCYGGEKTINGIRCAVLYAFTGKEHEDNQGVWWGHFWRYAKPLSPTLRGIKPEVLGLGWSRLADLPGLKVKEGAALAWVSMDYPGSIYPEGLVIALTQFVNGWGGVIYRYNPATNQWLFGTYVNADVKGGGCMTAINACSTRFFRGDNSHDCYIYDAVNNRIYPDAPLWQPVRDGAAIAQLGAYTYAEPGTQPDEATWFYKYLPPPESVEGSQGGRGFKSNLLRVRVIPAQNRHRFLVQCSSGPVRLAVCDASGRVISTAAANCYTDRVQLDWNHAEIASGVYFWTVSTTAGCKNGKVAIHN